MEKIYILFISLFLTLSLCSLEFSLEKADGSLTEKIMQAALDDKEKRDERRLGPIDYSIKFTLDSGAEYFLNGELGGGYAKTFNIPFFDHNELRRIFKDLITCSYFESRPLADQAELLVIYPIRSDGSEFFNRIGIYYYNHPSKKDKYFLQYRMIPSAYEELDKSLSLLDSTLAEYQYLAEQKIWSFADMVVGAFGWLRGANE